MLSVDKNINLLWTGGWDSTFHLLQLLLIHKVQVTPFYLIDEYRKSTGIEIRTMQRIKNRLFEKYPHTKVLLQPTQYFGVRDVLPDLEMEEAYKSIRKEKAFDSQYAWLARFCKQHAIMDMQLCIHRGDHASDNVLEDIVSTDPGGSLGGVHVDPKFNMTNEYTLFRYFSFPIFNLSKVQMASVANEQGWQEEMALTWFCRSPQKGKKPCGRCGACIFVIELGLGWRLPASTRISSYLHRTLIWPILPIAKRLYSRTHLKNYLDVYRDRSDWRE